MARAELECSKNSRKLIRKIQDNPIGTYKQIRKPKQLASI